MMFHTNKEQKYILPKKHDSYLFVCNTFFVTPFKALPHVTISPTMPTSTMEFNEIVDDGPATRNDIVNDADVK